MYSYYVNQDIYLTIKYLCVIFVIDIYLLFTFFFCVPSGVSLDVPCKIHYVS